MVSDFLIHASNLYKIYPTSGIEVAIIKGISLHIHPGEKVILIGPSGSGKTTLVNMLIGEEIPSAGQIFWKNSEGKDISKLPRNSLTKVRRQFMSIVTQKNNLLPQINVKENILLPAEFGNMNINDTIQQMGVLVDLLKIKPLLNRKPNSLSQGEIKRVNIAAALITKPNLLIADEPITGLDPPIADEILDLFDEINEQLDTTLLMTTHDQLVADRGTRILELNDGVLSGTHVEKINFSKLEKTRKLVVDTEGRVKIPRDILNEMNTPSIMKLKFKDGKIELEKVDEDHHEGNYYQCLNCNRIQLKEICTDCGNPTILLKK